MAKKKKTKKDVNYTTAEIKDMFMRDSSNLEYGRVNITIPLSLKKKIACTYKDETRSRLITRLLIDDLEKTERKKMLNKEALKAAKNQHLHKKVLQDFGDLGLEDWNGD